MKTPPPTYSYSSDPQTPPPRFPYDYSMLLYSLWAIKSRAIDRLFWLMIFVIVYWRSVGPLWCGSSVWANWEQWHGCQSVGHQTYIGEPLYTGVGRNDCEMRTFSEFPYGVIEFRLMRGSWLNPVHHIHLIHIDTFVVVFFLLNKIKIIVYGQTLW